MPHLPATDTALDENPTPADGHAVQARALQTQAVDAVGLDAAGLLIEAANQWRLAGAPDRSLELLRTVVDSGGEGGCYARAELAGILLDSGAVDAATRELDALATDPALTDGPCQMVGELLTDHGAPADALRWYDRAIAFWSPARLAAAGTERDGRPSVDRAVLQQRTRLRKRLALPPA